MSYINVLSLFDGISCAQVAMNRTGIKDYTYFASEIKKTAIKVTQYHYPTTIQLGSVVDVNWLGLPKIDILFGGSPCHGNSGLNKNRDGLKNAESILFWQYVRILEQLRTINPVIEFLFENTQGHKEATKIITETLGVKPISINSALVSAQNRPRYYWTNIPGVQQPEKKEYTTHTLQNYFKQRPVGAEVPENRVKWLLSESGKKSVAKGYTRVNPFPKYGCITANGHKKWNENYILIDGKYYFLSQFELEWLQTLPPGYTDILTYDEAYDVIGDAWTVDVIAHILSYSKHSPPTE